MASTLPSMPRKAWWCPSCDQVTFERNGRERDDYHAQGWGPGGIVQCPGRWQRVTMHRGHEPIVVHTVKPKLHEGLGGVGPAPFT